MANTKIYPDGESLSAWFALENYAVDPANPTVAELNAALNVTCAIAWDGYSFGSQASTQTSDPSWCDVGNTQTRGFAQFGGSISFFYPSNYTDLTDVYVQTFLALEEPLTVGYLIIRVDGKKTTGGSPDVDKPAVAGDLVRIYKVMSDGWADSVTGENSFKYSVTFQPQGDVWVNANVGPVTVETPSAIGAADYTVGGKTPLGSYKAGRQLASVSGEWNGTPGWLQWSSSDTTVASVDRNAVVTGVGAGTAEITATDPITGVSSTPLEVTIA